MVLKHIYTLLHHYESRLLHQFQTRRQYVSKLPKQIQQFQSYNDGKIAKANKEKIWKWGFYLMAQMTADLG